MISAVAHTANYLRLCAERMQHVEDQVCDISQQLMNLNDSNKFGTEDYWKRQQVEILKNMMRYDVTLGEALEKSELAIEFLRSNIKPLVEEDEEHF